MPQICLVSQTNTQLTWCDVLVLFVLFLYKGALASTTSTATTKPQINNLIGRVRKNKRAARAARTYEQVRAVLCKTTT